MKYLLLDINYHKTCFSYLFYFITCFQLEIRTLDIYLMKQFIAIDDSIRELIPENYNGTNMIKRFWFNKVWGCCRSNNMDIYPTDHVPLVRRQSVPNYCKMECQDRKTKTVSRTCRDVTSILSEPKIYSNISSITYLHSVPCLRFMETNENEINDNSVYTDTLSRDRWSESTSLSSYRNAAYNYGNLSDPVIARCHRLDRDSLSFYEDILIANIDIWKFCSSQNMLSTSTPRSSFSSSSDSSVFTDSEW